MILYSISKLIHTKYFYFWCLIFYIQNNSSLLVCAANVIVIIIKEPLVCGTQLFILREWLR